MKRLLLCFVSSLTVLNLSSCRVEFHTGEQRILLPARIGIPILIALILLILFIVCFVEMYYLTHRKFRCPKCGAEISPHWYEFSALLHQNNRSVMKCPDCKRKGFCDLIGKI